MNIKRIIVKNNQRTYNLEIEEDNGFYKIVCLSPELTEMGCVMFKLNTKSCWLYKIKTEEAFQRQGIGSQLLTIMGKIALENNINFIEGKFYPENAYARSFYEKNGYYVPNKTRDWNEYDDSWTLCKLLNKEETKQFLANEIIEEKNI